MNWNQIEGNWNTFKAKARQKWGKLTDDDMEQIRGRREELGARLQKRYGDQRDALERQVDEWVRKLDAKDAEAKRPRA
jgi:uncharacterized protein YjbJ (UPF0337 family)